MWWHIFACESFHGSCACGLSVAHSSCNFGGKGGRTQWSRYLWNLVLTSNFNCGTDLRRFTQRLMTCPFENIVALKRLSSMQLHETMFGIFFGLLLLLLLIFFNVCFQMSLLYVCMKSFANSLLAFVWLFPTVRFQMSPQTVSLWGCKVTLIAFVSLFSTVRFQMSPQIT